MQIDIQCVSCIVDKEVQRLEAQEDTTKKLDYMMEVIACLKAHAKSEPAPVLSMRIDKIRQRYFPSSVDFQPIKDRYNAWMLKKLPIFQAQLQASPDAFAQAIRLVCAGNYIDFGTVNDINEDQLVQILEKAKEQKLDSEILANLKDDLSKASEVVYLCDNCGEIILDTLLMDEILKDYPHCHLTVVVRGQDVLNDTTYSDCQKLGLTEKYDIMANGTAIPGTFYQLSNEETQKALRQADVIFSKGQGNFEGMYGTNFNTYYMFLCKCSLFTKRFGMKLFAPVFANEKNISKTLHQKG